MQVCTSLQTDNHASTPPLSFLQAGCPSYCPTNRVKALKAQHKHSRSLLTSCCRTDNKRPHHCWHLPKKDWEYWLLARYSLHSIMGSEMPPKLPIPLGYLSPTHINTWFLGPTGVHSPNSRSAVFVGLTVVTNRHTFDSRHCAIAYNFPARRLITSNITHQCRDKSHTQLRKLTAKSVWC